MTIGTEQVSYRYWIIDTRTNQKLGDFGDLKAADERCDVLDDEAGDRFHIIRRMVQRDGQWVRHDGVLEG